MVGADVATGVLTTFSITAGGLLPQADRKTAKANKRPIMNCFFMIIVLHKD
jgi:hypothetical protein